MCVCFVLAASFHDAPWQADGRMQKNWRIVYIYILSSQKRISTTHGWAIQRPNFTHFRMKWASSEWLVKPILIPQVCTEQETAFPKRTGIAKAKGETSVPQIFWTLSAEELSTWRFAPPFIICAKLEHQQWNWYCIYHSACSCRGQRLVSPWTVPALYSWYWFADGQLLSLKETKTEACGSGNCISNKLGNSTI